MSTAAPARSRLAELWRLSLPLVLAGFAQIAITLVDTTLVGRSGPIPLAAVALAAPVYLACVMVVRGWATAAQIVASRRTGAGDRAGVGTAAAGALVAAGGCGAALAAVVAVAAPHLMRLLGAEGEVVTAGTGYLRAVAAAVPLAAMSFVLQGVFAGTGATRVTMVMTLLVNVVNLPVGFVLILGLDLGAAGAGVATLISTAAGLAYLVGYGARRSLMTRADLLGWRRDGPVLWKLAWPETVVLSVGYFNEVLLAAFVGRLGVAELGAYRLVDNLTLILYTVVAAAGTAVGIAAGQRLGAGLVDEIHAVRRAGLALGAALVALPLLLALAIPGILYGLVTPDRDVVAAAVAATPIALAATIPLTITLTLSGILRAAGDNKAVMRASLAGDYMVLVPVAWLLGLHLGWGLPGIYTAWTGYWLAVTLILVRRYRSGVWRRLTV